MEFVKQVVVNEETLSIYYDGDEYHITKGKRLHERLNFNSATTIIIDPDDHEDRDVNIEIDGNYYWGVEGLRRLANYILEDVVPKLEAK